MPKVSDEDRLFAVRLGHVLKELREAAQRAEPGEWTQEKAAEKIGVPLTTLGRWERGQNAPKGYDLGRLYRKYRRFGAKWQWFLDPPEIIVRDPVRDALQEVPDLAHGAAELAQTDQESEEEPPSPGGDDGPRGGRGTS